MRALSSLLVCEYLDIPADVYASSFYPPSCPKCRPLHPKQSFFTVFGEVVCILGATPLRQPAGRGELHYMRVRHAGDTLSEDLV